MGILIKCGISPLRRAFDAELAQLARACPCQGQGCEFEPRIPLQNDHTILSLRM